MLVLRMFELCSDYRNFSEAKAKLLDFQRMLVTVSPPNVPPGVYYEEVMADGEVRVIQHAREDGSDPSLLVPDMWTRPNMPSGCVRDHLIQIEVL